MDLTLYQGAPCAAPQGRLDPKKLPNVRSLGKGLSGYIYETTWLGQGRYARKDFPLRSLKRRRVFKKEAKALLKLDHPCLVRCLGYTLGKSSSSLVQEYVDDDLQNVVQRRVEAQRVNSKSHSRVVGDIEKIKSLLSSKGKGTKGLDDGMPWNTLQFEMREAEDVISQIAAGMKYLHDMKIAHGDLKPKNVLFFLDESGKTKAVKIADYGLQGTKKLIRLVPKRTRHFEILTWKAPERFEELLGPVTQDSDHPFTDSDIDSDEDIGRYADFLESSLAMADVYSFGLTCSYILGAKLVFPELSLTQLRTQRMSDFKRIFDLLPPTCPNYLRSMIASCLQSDPVSRPTFSAICNTLKEDGGVWRSVNVVSPSYGSAGDLHSGKMKAGFTSHIYKGEMESGSASDQSLPTGPHLGDCEVKLPQSEEPLYPFLPLNLIGIEENMAKLEQMLEKSSKVGVVGMGGIGKTTLVKGFYDRKSKDFEASSILFDVYKGNDVLLCQQALLQDIMMDGLYNDSTPIQDKEVGKNLLRRFLSKKKVLIVLDDVREDFLDYLLPIGVEWHMGSKVILTSRDSSNLKLHVNEELEMQFLGRLEAMELFCMHAFKENSCPDKNLQEITNNIVDACGQLPLSLEVVGSFLSKNREKDVTFWEGALKKLKEVESLSSEVDTKLQNILKIGFDDLGESERGKFLDVACFFCSKLCSKVTKDMALNIWGLVDESFVELQNLIERHLVTINELGFLSMHDQLLAMGRNILRTESQYKQTRVSDECKGLRFEDVETLSCLEGLYLANKSLKDIMSKIPTIEDEGNA